MLKIPSACVSLHNALVITIYTFRYRIAAAAFVEAVNGSASFGKGSTATHIHPPKRSYCR
jgi:hypothetical protein